jgi:hypothetical protein
MLDSDLAALYRVETGALNRAVRRNLNLFPPDLLFQLAAQETENLKCQIGISNAWGCRLRRLPYAFTEQGVAMLSSVLRSPRAAQVNIAIMRAVVQLRQVLGSQTDLARKAEREGNRRIAILGIQGPREWREIVRSNDARTVRVHNRQLRREKPGSGLLLAGILIIS